MEVSEGGRGGAIGRSVHVVEIEGAELRRYERVPHVASSCCFQGNTQHVTFDDTRKKEHSKMNFQT